MIVDIYPDFVTDKPFSYLWNKEWPAPVFGQVVKVPLSKKTVYGVVAGLRESAEKVGSETNGVLAPLRGFRYAGCLSPSFQDGSMAQNDGIIKNLKIVTQLVREEPFLGEREKQIATWLAEYAFVSQAEALFALLPQRLTGKPRTKLPLAEEGADGPKPLLTDSQRRAVAAMHSGTYLLLGVTGSGKTEIYLELAERVRAVGRQVLILVPEISLTPQAVARFRARFKEPIAVYHSLLTAGERTAVWHAVKKGDVSIVVGSRSALLLPYQALGLIALDEEHDSSYHQEQTPYYDARRLAEQLTKFDPTLLVVMGSATPRLETYLRARAGKMGLTELTDRFGVGLPDIHILDRRNERGARELLSPILKERLDATLKAGNQAVLFLNRRGTAGAMICGDCGNAILCPRCELPLTYHQRDARPLVCHHCGLAELFPIDCPVCRHPLFRPGQFGTESLEEELGRLWPAARILRLDRDTMKDRSDFLRIYETFLEHKADILVGTTLVTKGWDIPGVSLVGVVSADQQLFFPDYQAAERTFQLITQVAGRAGRRILGEVYVQTLSPEHPAIRAAARHDYLAFVASEIGFRKSELFPPFAELIRLVVRGRDEAKTLERLKRVQAGLQSFTSNSVELLGPAPCFFPKIAEFYRFQLLLKVKAWPDGLADKLRALQAEPALVIQRGPTDML